MNWTELLTDKDTRRKVITISIIVAFFIIPLLVAVLTNDFLAKLEAMINATFEITSLGIAGIFTGALVIYDFKQRAVTDVRESDDDIDKSFIELNEKKSNIDNEIVPMAMNYIDTQNALEQENANFRLTQRKKQQCINKLTIARVKQRTRKIKRLEIALERYERGNLFDKKFKGLNYDDVLTVSSTKIKRERSYRERHVDNPTESNWWFRILSTPLRFLALGGSLVSSFALGIDWESLVIFYFLITLLTALTSLFVYVIVTNRVLNKTHKANKNMIKFIDNMLQQIKIDKAKQEKLPFDELDQDYSNGEIKE
jgi:hypothetical protein